MGLGLPLVSDVSDLLTQSGAKPEIVATLPLDRALKRAVEKFSNDTGFRPFLAAVGQRVESYPAPRSATLELRCGFVSISSIACGSETLVENEDYEVRRFKGWSDGPITEIKFFRRIGRTLVVTGVKGFCTELSQTVFDAITAQAALSLASSLNDTLSATSGSAGGAIKAKESGDVRIEYTTATDATSAKLKNSPVQWQADYLDAVAEHTLTVWGF